MKLKGTNRLYATLIVPFLFAFINCAQPTRASEPLILTEDPTRHSPSHYGSLYKWVKSYDSTQTIYTRFSPPPGFEMVSDTNDKFSCWLLHLPLKKDGAPVFLYNGNKKARQDVHAAVIDIDAGTRDLQQCADAVMRLRAEYLYGSGNKNAIKFNYTSGAVIPFAKWTEGFRPAVKGSKVSWNKTGSPSSDYPTFKNYLWNVFNYAGSKSLSGELKPVKDFNSIKAGDVLIIGGFPGHAMTVVQTAVNKQTGKKVFMLAQSYMPAQEIHIVRNFQNPGISPWYEIPDDGVIDTPEWTFGTADLKRW